MSGSGTGAAHQQRPFYHCESTQLSAYVLPAGAKTVPAPQNMLRPAPPTVLEPGTHVWLPDAAEIVHAAVVVGEPFCRGEAGAVQVASRPNPTKLDPVESAGLLPLDPQVLRPDIEDLITLDELSERAILHKLRQRYAGDAMYTSVSSVLVSVNPFKALAC